MRRRPLFLVVAVVVLLAGVLTSSVGARPSVGTADTPVMLSIRDGVDADAAEVMATALEIATGLHFEVVSVEYGQSGVDWLCDEFPARGLRIMPPIEYVHAKDDCGAKTSLALRRFGQEAQAGQFLVLHDSGLSSLADLANRAWYFSGNGSLTGYAAPLHMLIEAGVEGYIPVPAGTHRAAVEAVYDPPKTEPVFATTFVDARTEAEKEFLRVLDQTPPIPFEVAAFGPEFPDELRGQIEGLMQGFSSESHPAYWVWEDSFGSAYWSDGWVNVRWPDFHFLKDVMTSTGLEF